MLRRPPRVTRTNTPFPNTTLVRSLVYGEERRLQQLFSNLLENATRYTDRGGALHASVQRERGQAMIVIEDSAPGVSDDKRARLFERFYRVETSRNRASGGSGLGVTICRHIVQEIGRAYGRERGCQYL